MRKIMVVDDSGVMLRNAKALLEDDYEIQLAVSGKMALNLLSVKKPDLIFLDYEMPEMDGMETYRNIKTLANCADIPVIFLTGEEDETTINNILSEKPAGYIIKPPTKEKLVNMINNCLGSVEGSDYAAV